VPPPKTVMMIRISRRSRFVRWCWLGGWAPQQTSICVLFWRGFVLAPLVAVVMAAILGMILYWIVMTPAIWWFLGGALATIFLPIWAIALKRRRWPVLPAEHRQKSVIITVLVERVRAAKLKVCPLVELY